MSDTFIVTPAEAGAYPPSRLLVSAMDPGLRRGDGMLVGAVV